MLERAAGAPADRAGSLGDAAGTAARRAGLRADELAEDAAGDLLQLSVAAAGRAGDAFRSGLGALAVAALARRRDLDLDGPRHAGERIGELDPDRDSDIAAARAAAPVAREQIVPEEGREDVGQVREVEVARRVAAALEARVAVAVVAAGASRPWRALRTPRQRPESAPARQAPARRPGAARARASGRPS